MWWDRPLSSAAHTERHIQTCSAPASHARTHAHTQPLHTHAHSSTAAPSTPQTMASETSRPLWYLTRPVALISWPWGPSAVVAGGGRSDRDPALWRQSLVHPWGKGNSNVRWGCTWQLESFSLCTGALANHSPDAPYPQSSRSSHGRGCGPGHGGRGWGEATSRALWPLQTAHCTCLRHHGERHKLGHKQHWHLQGWIEK